MKDLVPLTTKHEYLSAQIESIETTLYRAAVDLAILAASHAELPDEMTQKDYDEKVKTFDENIPRLESALNVMKKLQSQLPEIV